MTPTLQIIHRVKSLCPVFEDRVAIAYSPDASIATWPLPYAFVLALREDAKGPSYTSTRPSSEVYLEVRQVYQIVVFWDPANSALRSKAILDVHDIRNSLIAALSGHATSEGSSALQYTGFRVLDSSSDAAVIIVFTFECIEPLDLSCYFEAWQNEPDALRSTHGAVAGVCLDVKTEGPVE